ncbi:MAG: pyruvate dehydrogenase (acetyl-transferring) E1 component subunit alpha [Dehalococcoidia bacterium]|nr:pyruvate dehydrogenase (acetyl-transferring) E1 component subunit alpha [Dehalococcoidia bacterium]
MNTRAAKAKPKAHVNGANDKQEFLELYRQMCLIRQFEEACGEQYSRGNIRGFLHLYIGQEAIAAGVMRSLRAEDYVVTHYRDHGHALARGLDTNRVMAELFGRATGLSKGKGGSMHIFDAAKGFMGGHAIVGGQLPLAAGLALACQYKGTGGIAVVFFGDGAVNQGVFHETMNLAAIWDLPLLFFLENNLYGMGTAAERTRAGGVDIYPIAGSYGIEAAMIDGMDVLAVREATGEAVKKIRAGEGPKFIEAKTYRFHGHSMADPARYRDHAELDYWLSRDPLKSFPKMMLDRELATAEELAVVRKSADDEVASAVKFSLESPPPAKSELFTDVYA